ncbi:N-myristoyl transferase [Choiromyces venosus 120613-1]|uniref:Glycylpeptide N-tetradecanoyltransferase n=1 Tax=Choiromyces venosus 120613-1 TaxID=1336337 RepID=A0A3N4JMD1_9PEZI|nr:N-myristoyl transferase [Choiromyces venosus 120613-1]
MSEESKLEVSKDKGKGKAKREEGELGAIPDNILEQLLKQNPGLASEVQGLDTKKLDELMKGMALKDVLTGMPAGGKNRKDMASYKFWNTQPVPKFGEDEPLPDGPLRESDLARVKTVGAELIEGFEWDTIDLTDDQQVKEVYELLSNHYVEDNEAMFRFNYSASFLHWALKAPGWVKNWHVGVRITSTKKLVAFISGIPVTLRVRENVLQCSEINFLCIHKKLRGKRLAPVLIKEVTRRCNLESVWNAIYTVGVVLPKPISTCRYFHRSLDWLKLFETGFSPLPASSTKAKQVTKYALPANTSTRGLREMEAKDLDAVHDLFTRYMERFDLVPKFTVEEIEHWLLNGGSKYDERIVWTYVVEEEGKITDFFSFYSLESSVIGKKETIRAVYLFYYASETAFSKSPDAKKELKARLNALIHDALILAKKLNFDVFNALTLLDNALFLEEQKFGAGDGSLHYYLFNWRTAAINGGIDERKNVDQERGSGVGVVML